MSKKNPEIASPELPHQLVGSATNDGFLIILSVAYGTLGRGLENPIKFGSSWFHSISVGSNITKSTFGEAMFYMALRFRSL